jgi:hypothetical protein
MDAPTDLSDILRHPTSDIHGIHDFLQPLFFTMTVTIRHSNSHGILTGVKPKKHVRLKLQRRDVVKEEDIRVWHAEQKQDSVSNAIIF